MSKYKDDVRRFFTYIETAPNGCWVWTGSLDGSGYGRFRRKSSGSRGAHRAAYEMLVGDIPNGAHILHSCDNPACVNPAHLSTGTHADNMAQAAARRRFKTGERNHNSKLSPSKVRRIRKMYADKVPHKDIAKMFGISVGRVSLVGRRLSWVHVE